MTRSTSSRYKYFFQGILTSLFKVLSLVTFLKFFHYLISKSIIKKRFEKQVTQIKLHGILISSFFINFNILQGLSSSFRKKNIQMLTSQAKTTKQLFKA